MSTIKTKFLGVGHYLPSRVLTNDQLTKEYGIDTSDEWIQTRTGIKQRHFVEPNQTNVDLGYEAAIRAIETAKIKKEEIDFILYATLSQDHEFPGNGCFLQARLGLPGVPAMDIRNQCTGFLYCLATADALIKTGQYKRILIVGSEIHSRGLDLSTRGRDVAILFGDGAGAAVLGATNSEDISGILSTHLHADGGYAKELWTEAPGSAFHPSRVTNLQIEEGLIFPKMNGRTVFVHAVKRMPEAVMEALNHNAHTLEDLDLLVPHQANIRINEAVAKGLGLPDRKVFNTIDRFGNTTAATIPIGLAEAVIQGKLKQGMLVALAAFGSGFTWGSCLLRW